MTTSRKSKAKADRWHLQRNLTPLPDGQHRWDRAYQNLLLWSQLVPNPELAPTLLPPAQSAPCLNKHKQEVPDDNAI